MEDEPIKTYHNGATIMIKNVVLERSGKNGEILERIRLVTDIGDMTCRLKKESKAKSELAGYDTVTEQVEPLPVSEFVVEHPRIKLLNDNCKKEPQEVVGSYVEMETTNKKTGKEETYYYMFENQFKGMYYKPFDKADTQNLEVMEKIKKDKGN